MSLTASKLRANIYRILDEVLRSGQPVEIERRGQLLKISPVEAPDRLEALQPDPDAIVGDPDGLVDIEWSGEWHP